MFQLMSPKGVKRLFGFRGSWVSLHCTEAECNNVALTSQSPIEI